MLSNDGVQRGGRQVVFANSPRKDGSDKRVRVFCPTFAKRGFIIAGHKPIVPMTHWIDGRTVLCTGPDCEGHQLGQVPRPKAYLACYWATSGFPVIVELSELAWDKIHNTSCDRGTLRGLVLYTSRLHQAKNAPVLIETKEPAKETPIPPDFHLAPHLGRLFGVDPSLFIVESTVGHTSHQSENIPT